MVEAQYIAATMKLVDTSAEQDLLEQIIEGSKPPLPPEARTLHFLLAAPFRYSPLPPGSRFRSATDPGVFYGAASVRTAAAEVGYWRWLFLCETAGLDRLGPAQHTAFSVQVDDEAVDLRIPPFDHDAGAWTDPRDYRATQLFASTAREAGIGVILYRSVRDPAPSWCAAVLTPRAFTTREPDNASQTWQLVVTQQEVIWRRGIAEGFSFPTAWWESL
ncbi:MAG TPA: RES family NAD+ phosphorylase [Geobacteraceae bacterium]